MWTLFNTEQFHPTNSKVKNEFGAQGIVDTRQKKTKKKQTNEN